MKLRRMSKTGRSRVSVESIKFFVGLEIFGIMPKIRETAADFFSVDGTVFSYVS